MTTALKSSSDLVFPKFDDIKVSTKTYTANTNLIINLDILYKQLPVTPYVVVVKKRGRKKKSDTADPNKDVEYGSILTIKYENEVRGVELKPKKTKQQETKKFFRNSITIVILLDKPVNFKVFRNGIFQMTGSKSHTHAESCVQYFWKYIQPYPDSYSYKTGTHLEALFIPSMRNIDFSLGFIVDREKLNEYMLNQEEFHCLLETSFGYTGVNIKVPLNKDITTMKVNKLIFSNDTQEWTSVLTTYQEYLDTLQPKERQLKLKAERYNTFLVFHSGKCIMSGLVADFMRDTYDYFLNIIRKAYDSIEERLD
jgi:TATA-box binding protein (TBP) (component of TFIID and TFIIIB)